MLIIHAKCEINQIVTLANGQVSCFNTTEADAIHTAKPCR